MSDPLIAAPWLLWSAALALGFPVAAVALEEIGAAVEVRSREAAGLVRMLRTTLLPILVVVLFLEFVLALDPDHLAWRVFATLFWIGVIHAALSFLNLVLFSAARDTSWRAHVPPLLRDLARLLLVLLGAAFVLSHVWGIDLGAMLTALGVGSLLIGLTLQDTFRNVFSGIALLAENPLRIGDWVDIDGATGRVTGANWRSVHIETTSRELLVIPNLTIAQGSIRNFSIDAVHAERVNVAFARGNRPNRVKAVLEEAARDLSHLAPGNAPTIRVRAYEPDCIVYEIALFIAGYAHAPTVRDQFATRLWYASQRGDLELRAPGDDPDLASSGPRRTDPEEVLQALGTVPALEGIDRSVLRSMLPGIRVLQFGAGEHIIRQGQKSEQLYIVLDGVASVYVEDVRRRGEELARLQRGQFFGEISLLGGGDTTAFVRATEDTEVLALSAGSVQTLLDAAPSLARALSQTAHARTRRISALAAAGAGAGTARI